MCVYVDFIFDSDFRALLASVRSSRILHSANWAERRAAYLQSLANHIRQIGHALVVAVLPHCQLQVFK